MNTYKQMMGPLGLGSQSTCTILHTKKSKRKSVTIYPFISFNSMYLEYHTSVISAYNDICSSLRNAWMC